jgi:hypothetical protein
MESAPNNINNTRLKLKRLTERGVLAETEGIVRTAAAVSRPAAPDQPAYPNRQGNTDIDSRTPLRCARPFDRLPWRCST